MKMVSEAFFVALFLPTVATAQFEFIEFQGPYGRAAEKTALAIYKYNGWDKDVKRMEERLLEKVPQEIQEVGSTAIWIHGVVTNRYISYSWSF